jgi:general stress protein YciG
MAKLKRPTDINQRAKSIVDIATGEVEETPEQISEIKAAAAALGRKGGKKGGKARAKALTPNRRSEIARKAAKARWHKKN